jgi:hypothetical protein
MSSRINQQHLASRTQLVAEGVKRVLTSSTAAKTVANIFFAILRIEGIPDVALGLHSS